MHVRLSTPGLIALIVIALAVGVAAAVKVALRPEEAFVSLAPQAKAGAATAVGSFNPALIYQERVTGVVTIEAVFGGDSVGGSGFVADADGHVLTSSHVVINYLDNAERPDALYVEFSSNDRVPAQLLGIDTFSDVAVLKVDPDDVRLHPVPLGDSDKVLVGESVAAIGAPFGNDESLTTGIVSATHRVVGSQINAASQIADAIQVDASINRGNSGGPLFNARGEVIGINQQIRTTSGVSEGVAFAVPINLARRSMRQIVDDGTVHYAYLGINSATLTPQLARENSLPVERGALLSAVSGPAAEAGLSAGGPDIVHMGETVRLGDVVVSIAHSPVTTKEDVMRIASRIEPGQSAEVVYYRDGKRQVTTLVAAEKAA